MDVDRQLSLLTAHAVDVISEAELRKKIERGVPLRVKLGIDPTASDIHLGFAVVLRRLRTFQDCGHKAVLIIGDFTAMLGDPSGKSATRPQLSKEEVDAYAESYVAQVGAILDMSPERIEIRRNSEWLARLDMQDVLRLTSQVTVARMLERDDFAKRYDAGAPISLMEFLYPLLQGKDSVEVRADVELGGTDQLFNLIMGRHLQTRAGQEPQVVLTTPLLVGLDGEQKMSKSLGNYIGVNEAPFEQFGKIMSIPDALLPMYIAYATAWSPERIDEVTDGAFIGRAAPQRDQATRRAHRRRPLPRRGRRRGGRSGVRPGPQGQGRAQRHSLLRLCRRARRGPTRSWRRDWRTRSERPAARFATDRSVAPVRWCTATAWSPTASMSCRSAAGDGPALPSGSLLQVPEAAVAPV